MKTKSEERRQHILKISGDVFREMGFDAASMAVISARIGGSKATLYNYFASKEELFAEVMLTMALELRGEAMAVLDLDLPLFKKLARFGVEYVQFKTSEKMLDIQRMAAIHAVKAKFGPHIYERGIKNCWGQIAVLLEKAMRDKELRKADPWLAATQLKALFEADVMDKRVLGLDVDLSAKALKKHVENALTVFQRAYATDRS